ncbi:MULTISPECIES: class I SAM-dependent methyltransferase [Mycobacterium]|uniref:SAM-dependent methyltransferase n=1 Tax=Mycobacterium gordonae TaxID=1778 RepID=A0A1A6BBC6_MYCGO|nr:MULTISPECIES: class I SAM-dependent methyltransferase [Mycobacterium]MBI2698317.1 methyltransferase domain-containing protein [Mycobacterium sp.]MBX9983616.1 methyltransferase domain-containing protein [Mycobacterium gordonae]MCQ4361551.1 class I SAM-dependent methyltransferase [Mycobacterium gordonae]MCV7007507.1 methyltransferase domain-containing protein [Mycobacterium gordonae]OBR99624.1 SAM-dependent methyltransferase [Mycobacterium gordonae]
MFRRRLTEAQHVMQPAVRLREQAQALVDYVGPGDTVLDVGCGTGHLSVYLRDMYGVVPHGIDVKDVRQTDIPFTEFDGTSIPFPDNAFDHVILSEVLHHSHDPVRLAAECDRVARRRIIVFEDMPQGLVGKLALQAHMQAFAYYRRYPFRPARLDEYRQALAWLATKAVDVQRIAQPPEWLTVYPRVLFIYDLEAGATT